MRILHSHAELYATTAAGGAAAYLAAARAALPVPLRILAGAGTAAAARVAAEAGDLRLPTWPEVLKRRAVNLQDEAVCRDLLRKRAN